MEGRDGRYDDYGRKVWTDAPLLDLQMEEGGSDPRNVGILQELEMAKQNKTNKQILSQSYQKRVQPCQHFDFSPV